MSPARSRCAGASSTSFRSTAICRCGYRRPYSDLLGARGDDASPSAAGALLGEAGELRPGDVTIHEDFGIGVVEGLEPVPDGAGTGGAIVLSYARGGKRLIPVAEADRLWRYGADADAVTLDALDGSSWLKGRGAIDAAIAESAKGLAAKAAERDARETASIVPDTADHKRFAAGFAFTETPDQARAINAVGADRLGQADGAIDRWRRRLWHEELLAEMAD